MFAHFQRLSLAFHERYTTGRMISRLTSDFDAINDMFTLGLDTLVTAVLSVVSVGIILLVLDWRLGLVCLTGLHPALLPHPAGTSGSRLRPTATRVTPWRSSSCSSPSRSRGIRAVHAFRRQARNDEIFRQLSEGYRTSMTRSFQLLGIYWPGIVLDRQPDDGRGAALRRAPGDRRATCRWVCWPSFVLYLRRFFEPLAEVSQFYDSFQGAAAGLEKLAGVLDEEPRVSFPEHGAPLPAGGLRGASTSAMSASATAEGPTCSSDFDPHVPAGQTVALLGATGAGKSTVARLLARFYDPLDGEVPVDGIALPDLARRRCTGAVAMVTQESFLFSGTVAENIAFGSPGADRRAVIDGRAGGRSSIASSRVLGDGYDERRREAGLASLGRPAPVVALARAFLADPAVLILDEASSSLDAPMERLVQYALKTVLAGRTALIIAHRLSTVEIADRVLVLDHGRIVEDGAPDELALPATLALCRPLPGMA